MNRENLIKIHQVYDQQNALAAAANDHDDFVDEFLDNDKASTGSKISAY